MPQSIFLGPQYVGEQADSLREIEEKMNASFTELYQLWPAATSTYPQTPLRFTVSSADGSIDPPDVSQIKVNAMLRALATASGSDYAPLEFDSSSGFPMGITPLVSESFNLTTAPMSVITLGALTLSANSLPEGSVAGTVVGQLSGYASTSSLSITDTAGSRFSLDGQRRVIAGSVATDFETATSHQITIRESNASASNSPRDTNLTVNVTNVLEIPANSVAPAISGSLTVGSTLTSTTGTWSDSPSSYARQWRRGGVDISGATGTTYVLTTADASSAITCRVTATNTAGTSAPATSNTLNTAVAPPVNSVAPAVTGTPAEGQTLTTTNGTWSGSPTYTRQWYGGATPYSGATATTFVVPAGQTGVSITCRVTATNAGGNATATSNAVTGT